jgi:lipoate-protein ligase A
LRLKRDHLLYHGTILYDFPLERLSRWLAAPARTPEYRADREHEAFVMNFPAARDAIVAALLSSWQADEPLHDWPRERTAALAEGRYATIEW